MKAIVYERYGPPEALQLKDVEQPVPTDNQMLIRVHAASVNALDWRPFTMSPVLVRIAGGGVRKPKNARLGADVAGIVESMGRNVTEFQPGDEVFGTCGAAFAEYACAGKSKLALKPANVSFEAAAATPVAAFTALQGLRDKGQVQPGQKVLIYGASGGVGTFAVQIAKAFGAEVTAVCSTRNLELARSIGADHVIDYTREDFTRDGRHYDLIFAVNGYRSIWEYRRALNPRGRYVGAGGSMAQILQAMALGPMLSKPDGGNFGFMGMAQTPRDDLTAIQQMLESGKLVPVVEKTYPLERTAEAMRYVIHEHARGKVVITVQ